jgi:hypothetical protein
MLLPLKYYKKRYYAYSTIDVTVICEEVASYFCMKLSLFSDLHVSIPYLYFKCWSSYINYKHNLTERLRISHTLSYAIKKSTDTKPTIK